ncbi:POPLD (NUC188) domain-containing protein [Toxoplasma gondii GAB2-2007-GAL-DOM2]|uniref:POPLD (NUC188) domain-containing protein n=2 Tax=Toxoplasma gondii TaxID=5811 RepID=V4ZDJ4_TOXGV|nr:POPLD (NUC188) domain-containing protein [Toxoplasma gondii VEG]KFG35389.1 POPLD (NUC188) domain-containing protein [Toxoplasma gondii GAB2-2007-GAL-DOM2]
MAVGTGPPHRGASQKKRQRPDQSASGERLENPTSSTSAAATSSQLLSACPYSAAVQVSSGRMGHKESVSFSSGASAIPFFPPLSPLPPFPAEAQSVTVAAGTEEPPSFPDTLRSASGTPQIPPLPQLLSVPALVRARERELRSLLEGIRNIPHHLHAKQHQQREQNQQLRKQRQQEQLPRKQRHQLEASGDAEDATREETGRASRIEHQGVAKRAFQRLHVELRRRCMSYNPYRVPRRCRRPILEEMAKAPPRPSRRVRKDRRRPAALATIYSRRAAFPRRWLATHFFHAKRFHMVNLWGYRLASHPTQRCQRKLYRYSKHKALIHDRSYMQLLELRGSVEALSAVLVSCGADASVFLSRLFISGRQRGRLSLFTRGLSEERRTFIGPAEFLWKPVEPEPDDYSQNGTPGTRNQGSPEPDGKKRRDEVRTLWLWIHPSASDAAHKEIRGAAEALQATQQGGSSSVGHRDPCADDVSMGDSGAVQIELIDDVAWFELVGPHALALLALTLKTPSIRRCLQQHCKQTREEAKGSEDLAFGEPFLGEAHLETPPASEATRLQRDQLMSATTDPAAVTPQLWWKRLTHETLTNGCCSAAPPGDAILPLDVFLPPLLGPFPPRTRRIPGVPAKQSQEPQKQSSQLDDLYRFAWCESRWAASRLFDKAVRSEATAEASSSLWEPVRRSRKRLNLKKLLMRLKEKQDARQALRAQRGLPHPDKGHSEETTVRGASLRALLQTRQKVNSLSCGTRQRGIAKRSHDSDWEDLPDTAEVREEGKRRRHKEEAGGGIAEGLQRGTQPKPGPCGFQETSLELCSSLDQNSVRIGEEELGEVVALPDLPHEQAQVLSANASAGIVSSSVVASGKEASPSDAARVARVGGEIVIPPDVNTGANDASPLSGRPVDSAPAVRTAARSDNVGSVSAGGSRSSVEKLIPCLVVWRAPPAAPYRSFVATASGSFDKVEGKHSFPACVVPSRSEQISATGPSSPFSGIDLFLPVSSAVARLFVLLCRYGARPIGCRDRRKLLLESGAPDFPFDFPDSQAGTHAALCAAWQDELRHHRKPPGKRVNFAVNATPCPFFPTWRLALKPCGSANPAGVSESHGFPDHSSGLAHQAGDVPASQGASALIHPIAPAAADACGEAPVALPAWARSAFSAYIKREQRKGFRLEASFLPPTVLPWLVPPLCQKSRKRKSLPDFRADVPLMPALPPVPSRLPFPEPFLPVPVLRVSHLDFLRFLASERRCRNNMSCGGPGRMHQLSVKGKQATTPKEGAAMEKRRKPERVASSTPGASCSLRGAAQAFLAEVSSLLQGAQFEHKTPDRCSVQRSERRQRGSNRCSLGSGGGGDVFEGERIEAGESSLEGPKACQADADAELGRGVASHEVENAHVTARMLCEMEESGSVSNQSKRTSEVDNLPVTGAMAVQCALPRIPSESPVSGWFVPVQVEAHLRGVPRRLCQLFLMTKEDLLLFFENNGSSLDADARSRRASNGVTAQSPRRIVPARPEAFSLEEPVHKRFTRSQLEKKALERGPPRDGKTAKGGASETAVAERPADPYTRNQPCSNKADCASPNVPKSTFDPEREITHTMEQEGRLPSNPFAKREEGTGFWTQTVAATLASNSRRAKTISMRNYGTQCSESGQRERTSTSALPTHGAEIECFDLGPQRRLIGFVTTGQHSLARGKGFGMACVSAEAFLEALQLQLRVLCRGNRSAPGYSHEPAHGSRTRRVDVDCLGVKLLVWLRNIQSRRYHPAWISMVIQD